MFGVGSVVCRGVVGIGGRGGTIWSSNDCTVKATHSSELMAVRVNLWGPWEELHT